MEQEYGNIFVRITTFEDIIRVKEAQLKIMPSPQNRAELSRSEAELSRFMKLEKEFWQIKGEMRYFKQGDKNTKFFHSYVQGKNSVLLKSKP